MLESDARQLVWLTTGATMDLATLSALEVTKTQIGVEVSLTVIARQNSACTSKDQVAGMTSHATELTPSFADYLSARGSKSSRLAPSLPLGFLKERRRRLISAIQLQSTQITLKLLAVPSVIRVIATAQQEARLQSQSNQPIRK